MLGSCCGWGAHLRSYVRIGESMIHAIVVAASLISLLKVVYCARVLAVDCGWLVQIPSAHALILPVVISETLLTYALLAVT